MWIWLQRSEVPATPEGLYSVENIESLRTWRVQPSNRANQTIWVDSVRREFVLAFFDGAVDDGIKIVAAHVCGASGPPLPVCPKCGEELSSGGEHVPDGPARLSSCGGSATSTQALYRISQLTLPLWKRRGMTKSEAEEAVRTLIDCTTSQAEHGREFAQAVAIAMDKVMERWLGKITVSDAMNGLCSVFMNYMTDHLTERGIVEMVDAWMFVCQQVAEDERNKLS